MYYSCDFLFWLLFACIFLIIVKFMWNIVESIPGLKVKVPQANNHNADKWTYKRKQFEYICAQKTILLEFVSLAIYNSTSASCPVAPVEFPVACYNIECQSMQMTDRWNAFALFLCSLPGPHVRLVACLVHSTRACIFLFSCVRQARSASGRHVCKLWFII